jgi:hypothetical protein
MSGHLARIRSKLSQLLDSPQDCKVALDVDQCQISRSGHFKQGGSCYFG